MKAIIRLDVPDWQIDQDVSVYFPDTMVKHSKCELEKEHKPIVYCIDCRHADISPNGLIKCQGRFRCKDWFCADGEQKEAR